MGDLKDLAKADIQTITTNTGEWADEITIKTPDEAISADITGLHTKINLGVDQEGNIINSKKAHISISEQVLIDLDYPVRNAADEVDIKGHKIYVKDSTGKLCSYVIKTCIPNETIGLLTCILTDLEE